MHILLNPISVTDYRIQDKYQTYQDIVNYLNQYAHPIVDLYLKLTRDLRGKLIHPRGQ